MTTSFRHLSALLAFLGSAALSSFAMAQECTTDADCGEGEYCSPTPCPAIDCDPSDPSCPECPETGICTAGFDGTTECTTDADCGAGFVCESVGGTDCAVPTCPEGTECPEVDCTSEEIFACVPDRSACTSDADCAEGLQCETYTYEQCSGGGSVPPCAPGEDCPQPEPVEPECETITESYCLPPYLGACTADADCGPGFTCEEYENCGCSSSGSSGSSGGSDGGVPPLPPDGSDVPPSEGTPEEDCSCEPSGEFYCELVQVECTTDADCIDGFVCVDSPDAGVPCTITPDGTEECGEPVESPSLCLPESYGDWVGAGGGFPGSADDLASESGGAPRTDTEQNAASSDDPTEEDGCSSTGTPAASMPLWLGLAALIGFRRRKA
jgi:MYXO-CTERM domain-containing protein